MNLDMESGAEGHAFSRSAEVARLRNRAARSRSGPERRLAAGLTRATCSKKRKSGFP